MQMSTNSTLYMIYAHDFKELFCVVIAGVGFEPTTSRL